VLRLDGDIVKLECHFADKTLCDYTTLSHRWASPQSQPLTLKESNLEEYQCGIAFRDLPPIFQEAIRLTRLLGSKHLWIDSLCIIQDSPADWQYEASKMASVYGNALCNLACVLPPDRASGASQHEIRGATYHACCAQQPEIHAECLLRAPNCSTPEIVVMATLNFNEIVLMNGHHPLEHGM
jgi:hypothetical protein